MIDHSCVPSAPPAPAGRPCLVGVFIVGAFAILFGAEATLARPDVFAPDNLVAWRIVPYDGKHRTPARRADMLQRLGFKPCDRRDEHLPRFDAKLSELKKRGVELTAVS